MFRGQRFDVSDKMHTHVLKAVGAKGDGADWYALYAEWDSAAVKADEPVWNPLPWLKEKARQRFGDSQKPTVCRHRHTPPCPDDATCTTRYMREQIHPVEVA